MVHALHVLGFTKVWGKGTPALEFASKHFIHRIIPLSTPVPGQELLLNLEGTLGISLLSASPHPTHY